MRKSPHWVKLFLRELECTGNVRLAAERAGVDFTSAYQRRKRHAEFAEKWGAALRIHSGQMSSQEEAPHPDPLPQGEREQAVRPDGKVIKGSDARWGKRAEGRFLTELTVSANVRRAAEAAGFSTTAVYQRRMKDRRLAAAWDAALEAGKARVQAYLLEAATRTFDPDDLPVGDERELPKVSVSEAINIAKLPGRDARGPGSARTGKANEWEYPEDYEDWQAAKARIVERIGRLREKMDEEERETGRCRSCGQVLQA